MVKKLLGIEQTSKKGGRGKNKRDSWVSGSAEHRRQKQEMKHTKLAASHGVDRVTPSLALDPGPGGLWFGC